MFSCLLSPYLLHLSFPFCALCAKDLHEVHQGAPMTLLLGLGLESGSPGRRSEEEKKLRLSVFRSPTNFLQGRLWPAVSFSKSHCFSQGGLLNSTLYFSHKGLLPLSLRCKDSNGSSLTTSGFLQNPLWLPYHSYVNIESLFR